MEIVSTQINHAQNGLIIKMPLGSSLVKLNKTFIEDKDRFIDVNIEDIPIMYCEDGSICCIPKEEEVFSLAIVGASGFGKSLALNRIHSHLFYQWKTNVCLMNDISEESFKWSEPMKFRAFKEFNRLYLNQEPCPSPIVYVYPNTNTLDLDLDFLRDKNYIKTVMPFADIIEDIGFYLSGINPEFDVGKSGMYINDLKDSLSECDTAMQVREILTEELPGREGKNFRAMRIKILTAFDSLFKEEILDITNPECHAYIRLNNAPLKNPFITLMKAGVIPSFITSDLSTKKYKSQIFACHINSIFQNHNKEFPGEKTFLLFDELRTVCETDNDPAAKAIGQVAARGRIMNVGLVYATQFYDKIPNCVKGPKLNYLMAFNHNNSKILNEIGSDFDLNKRVKERIKKLKKYECFAMTKNKFIFYRDGERWEDSQPVKGRIFYPVANHQTVGKK